MELKHSPFSYQMSYHTNLIWKPLCNCACDQMNIILVPGWLSSSILSVGLRDEPLMAEILMMMMMNGDPGIPGEEEEEGGGQLARLEMQAGEEPRSQSQKVPSCLSFH